MEIYLDLSSKAENEQQLFQLCLFQQKMAGQQDRKEKSSLSGKGYSKRDETHPSSNSQLHFHSLFTSLQMSGHKEQRGFLEGGTEKASSYLFLQNLMAAGLEQAAKGATELLCPEHTGMENNKAKCWNTFVQRTAKSKKEGRTEI